jgi:hypothetical protein
MLCVRRIAGTVLAVLCALLLASAPVAAQSRDPSAAPPVPPPAPPPAYVEDSVWRDKAFLDVNVGMRLTSNPFEEHISTIIYSEPASISAAHEVSARWSLVDLAGGVRVWKSVGIGGAYAKFSVAEDVNVGARVPNPVLFNQTRSATKVTPLERNETAFHFHALYVRPVTPRIDVMLSAGPSVIQVSQDLVTGIELSEGDAPFTTVAIGNVLTVAQTERIFGLNFGIGGTYFMTPLVGIGGTLRYVTGSLAAQQIDGQSVDVPLGGFQLAFGARVRFR